MSVKDDWSMICPECKADDSLSVAALIWCDLSTDGTEPNGDHEWDDDAACRCNACNWSGTVADARAASDMQGDGGRASFNAATMQSFRSHIGDDWDAIFRVEVGGVSHAVFASRTPDGEWSQWGAQREALSAAVDITEAWAKQESENV